MKKLKIAAMGVEHRHIFGQLEGMLNLDCEFVGWWTKNDNRVSKDALLLTRTMPCNSSAPLTFVTLHCLKTNK